MKNVTVKRIKIFVLNIVLLSVVLFLLNAMLPPDDVANNIDPHTDMSFLKGHDEGVALKQNYAKWTYSNYIVVKYAHSDPLNVTLAAYPFTQWMAQN